MTQPAITLAATPAPAGRRRYLVLLAWGFAASNLLRVLTYLPTIWAIRESGQSDQHSLLTWVGCLLANLTMSAWIYEHNGRRFDRAVAMNADNALMCGALAAVILWYR